MIHPAQRRPGFTLVELLVVIAIIAIIAGLVVPGLMNAQRRAYVTKCTANLTGLHKVAFLYAQRKQYFPFGTDVKEPRAHESLNALVHSVQGEELEPEIFDCPEGAAVTALKDPQAKDAGYMLDEDTLDYAWTSERTKLTKKAYLSSDKWAGGIDDIYADGETHDGHNKMILVLDTSGRVQEVEISQYTTEDSKVPLTDDLLPEGLTR